MNREQFDEFRNAIWELALPLDRTDLLSAIQLLGHSLTGGMGAEYDVPELVNGYNPNAEEVFSAIGWVLGRLAQASQR